MHMIRNIDNHTTTTNNNDNNNNNNDKDEPNDIKAQSDGATGWATIQDNAGSVYLQAMFIRRV